jgi:RNase adapter protein RapZ
VNERRLVIVSGLSGAGKTIALHALEDAGYYCVDNLPVGILLSFAAYIAQQDLPYFHQVAVGIDARNYLAAISELPDCLDALQAQRFKAELIFVDASDETLLRRFSETRRKHPLSSENISLPDAIKQERVVLDAVIMRADVRIDTTHTNVHELRTLIRDQIANRPTGTLALQFRSFGFKNGVPQEADFVFDVRCLPNPYWDPALRELSGADREVREFLDGMPMVTDMVSDIEAFLETWIPKFEDANRSYLTVAFGCTGGRHRSVYVAERLAKRFRTIGKKAVISHRDAIIAAQTI